MIMDAIPLEVFSRENGFHANIEISVDGHKTKVLLDTGAPTSRVKTSKFIAKYKAIDKRESKGV